MHAVIATRDSRTNLELLSQTVVTVNVADCSKIEVYQSKQMKKTIYENNNEYIGLEAV